MYRFIDARFWTDSKVRELSLADRYAFLYLLTNPHTNMLGLYRLPLPYMADDLQRSLNTCRMAIERLSNGDLIAYDQANNMVFVKHFLKYNPIKGGNRETAALNRLSGLPPTPLLSDLHNAIIQLQPELEQLIGMLKTMVSEQCPNGIETALEHHTNTDRTKIKNKNKNKKQDKKHVSSYSKDFETFWTFWLSLNRDENKLGAFDKWNACLKGRNGKKPHPPVPVAELLTAGEHYRDKCVAEGTEPRHVMLAITFLGINQRWKDYVEVKEFVHPDEAYANEIIEEAGRDED